MKLIMRDVMKNLLSLFFTHATVLNSTPKGAKYSGGTIIKTVNKLAILQNNPTKRRVR